MNRAYSLLTVKNVDDDKRIVTGIATTPAADRVGDIVESEGAEFSLPIPFLWQHNSSQPIGHVVKARVSKKGIEVEVHIQKTDEPGPVKDRLDAAWQDIKLGLVRGLSIGFKALELARIADTYSYRYIKWLWLELSGVTIPANGDCSIQTIKSLDTALLAASGRRDGVVHLNPPSALGLIATMEADLRRFTRMMPKEGKDVKTISEQIREWEAKRQAKAARMEEIMTESGDAGTTLDTAESEEYDTVKGEVEQIDKHLARLNDMQKVMKAKAVPVAGADPEEAANSREGNARVQVLEPKLEKGIGFARYVMCMAAAKGDPSGAERIAKARFPTYVPLHNILKSAVEVGGIDLSYIRKAAVGGGTTADTNFATALVNYQDVAGEFIEYLRPQTIIGKFGTGGIPSLRRVPFNIRVPRQTTKASGYWVGEGKPKPLTKFNTDQITLDFHKVATICALTKELVRFSNPSAEALVRDELARAIIERIDIDFIDPNKAVSAGVSPASITNGVTAPASAGDTAANVRTDVQTLFSEFVQANMPITGAVWIMNANLGLALSMMMNDLGQPEWPAVTMNGGTFVGLPVIVSQYVAEALLILVSAPDIYLADDGNVTIDASEEASLEMLDGSLQQDGTAGTGASLVSLWQTNMVGIRAEREITWLKRRPEAVQYMTSVNWGGTAGSGDL